MTNAFHLKIGRHVTDCWEVCSDVFLGEGPPSPSDESHAVGGAIRFAGRRNWCLKPVWKTMPGMKRRTNTSIVASLPAGALLRYS